jgi:hypothetical protein
MNTDPNVWRWFTFCLGLLLLLMSWAAPRRNGRGLMLVLFWTGFFCFGASVFGRW